MANKRRFKPSRTAIGFRQRGQGLGAAVTRLQEQANIEIQGLKDIQTQTQAQAKDYLNSLSDKYQNEADVRRIHHELEDEVDKNIIESARVRADQEIKDAENEAFEDIESKVDHAILDFPGFEIINKQSRDARVSPPKFLNAISRLWQF